MTSRTCQCGCGRSTKSRFAPGHDMRLRGEMVRSLRSGTAAGREEALRIATRHKWEKHLYPGIQRTFGVELEVISPVTAQTIADALHGAGVEAHAEGYNHSTRSHWKVTTDSSVRQIGKHGLEVVSPPLFGAEGRKQVKLVCKVLRQLGVTVNRTCGMHVHHAAHDLSLDDMRLLVANYGDLQERVDAVLAPSRRGNQYCRRIDGTYRRKLNEATSISQLSSLNRYHVLNLTSYPRYGTVEFRQHQGTINAEKILQWVETGQHLIRASREGQSLRSFRDFLPSAQVNYYERRAAALAA